MQNRLMQDTRGKPCPYEKSCPIKTDRCRVDQMNTAKILIPNKEWVVTENQQKIGAITKDKKGYQFIHKGKSVGFKSLSDLKTQLGIELFEENIKKKTVELENKSFVIYDFPCSSKPYESVYSVKEKLPLFAKSAKSKSRYCAGYYVIKFRKGWVKSFCPKLITLQRYSFYGPFKTETEMKATLNSINKS